MESLGGVIKTTENAVTQGFAERQLYSDLQRHKRETLRQLLIEDPLSKKLLNGSKSQTPFRDVYERRRQIKTLNEEALKLLFGKVRASEIQTEAEVKDCGPQLNEDSMPQIPLRRKRLKLKANIPTIQELREFSLKRISTARKARASYINISTGASIKVACLLEQLKVESKMIPQHLSLESIDKKVAICNQGLTAVNFSLDYYQRVNLNLPMPRASVSKTGLYYLEFSVHNSMPIASYKVSISLQNEHNSSQALKIPLRLLTNEGQICGLAISLSCLNNRNMRSSIADIQRSSILSQSKRDIQQAIFAEELNQMLYAEVFVNGLSLCKKSMSREFLLTNDGLLKITFELPCQTTLTVNFGKEPFKYDPTFTSSCVLVQKTKVTPMSSLQLEN